MLVNIILFSFMGLLLFVLLFIANAIRDFVVVFSRAVDWLETQELKTIINTSRGFSDIPVGDSSTVFKGEKVSHNKNWEEEFAIKSAELRDMDYSGFESNMGALGDDYEEEDDSRDVVEKLKKFNRGG